MWANYYSSDNALYAHPTKQDAIRRSFGQAKLNAIPVAVIPLDDVEALIDVAGHAFSAAHDGHLCKSDIVAMLTDIGVLPKPRKGRK